MDKKHKYLNELEYHLALSPKTCNEVIIDLLERIEDEEKEGVNIEVILKKMGTPQELAKELNETYFTTRNIEYFEYKSNKESKFPLIHIVIKNKFNKKNNRKSKVPIARGVIAFGRYAQGVISIGGFSQGIISLGLISMGVISGGSISIGVVAVGILALGGISIGTLAIGVMAIGNFLYGYSTFGNIVVGKFAFGNIVSGNVEVPIGNNPSIEQIIKYLNEIIDKSKDYPLSNSFYKTLQNIVENPSLFVISLIFVSVFLFGVYCIYRLNLKKVYMK